MDEERFRALYAGTVQDVWRYVRRRTHDATEADDVTAEVYATAWRRRHELPPDQPIPSTESTTRSGAGGPGDPAGERAGDQAGGQAGGQARLWLFGTARLTLSNHHRDANRRDRLHLRIATTDPPPATYQPSPRIEDEHAATVWTAMAALSEQDRELLLLRAWDGLAVADIATLLHLGPPLVSSRLHQARQRLRRHLQSTQLPSSPPPAGGPQRAAPPAEQAPAQQAPGAPVTTAAVRRPPRPASPPAVNDEGEPQEHPIQESALRRDPRGAGHVVDEPRMERSTR